MLLANTYTGNLLKRSNVNTSAETFSYDKADRLTTGVTYAANGNIATKTSIGQYAYNSANPMVHCTLLTTLYMFVAGRIDENINSSLYKMYLANKNKTKKTYHHEKNDSNNHSYSVLWCFGLGG